MIHLRPLLIGALALACAGCSGMISRRVADETYRVMVASRDAAATAELTLASLRAATSKLLGGDDGAAALARARAATGGGVLLVEVVAARGAAVAHGDRAGFESTLRQVLTADLARWPEHRMVNELAVRKARRYLDHAEVLFE